MAYGWGTAKIQIQQRTSTFWGQQKETRSVAPPNFRSVCIAALLQSFWPGNWRSLLLPDLPWGSRTLHRAGGVSSMGFICCFKSQSLLSTSPLRIAASSLKPSSLTLHGCQGQREWATLVLRASLSPSFSARGFCSMILESMRYETAFLNCIYFLLHDNGAEVVLYVALALNTRECTVIWSHLLKYVSLVTEVRY